jgi:O-antigen/teichoic acid export membrane protein
MRVRWRKPKDTTLARNTLWVALGQVLRVGVQAAYFVLIARSLGSREYGAYVGVLAIVAIAAPFASLGSGNLLIKHVARTPNSFARCWGKALATTMLTGTILLGIVTIVARAWLPASIPLPLVLAIGAADLLFVRLVDVSAQAYQAHQRLSRTALLQLLLSPLRVIAAIILLAITSAPTAVEWGTVYLVGALIGAGVAVLLVNRELGAPEFHVRDLGSELREGAFFATILSAQSTTNDIDKAMLARLGTLNATGVYAAAYRLVDLAFLPVGSLLVATYARFFQHGVQGVHATTRYARRLLSLGACYGLLAGIGLYFLAPLVPTLLGNEYLGAVAAVRWLAILPLLKAVHYFGADALTGAGYQGVRAILLVSIAAVNVLLNMVLIPLYSWRGAAIATIASDGLLGAAIWTTLWYLGRHGSQRHPSENAALAEVGEPTITAAELPHQV